MRTLIADSGSTKTDWALTGGGEPTRYASTRGLNPFHCSMEEIGRTLRDDLRPQLGGEEPQVIAFYGSGCRREMEEPMAKVMGEVFPKAETCHVASDILGAALALFGKSEGVACILGTGSNSCLYDGQHIVANTPALGYILGDEGGGAALGKAFVKAVYRGTLPASVRTAFEQRSHLTQADIIRKVYREPEANRFLASLSQYILPLTQTEPEVRAIVTGCFRRFLHENVAPYGRRDLPVGFVGSIAYYYQDLLREAVEAEGMRMGRILRSPIEGLTEWYG